VIWSYIIHKDLAPRECPNDVRFFKPQPLRDLVIVSLLPLTKWEPLNLLFSFHRKLKQSLLMFSKIPLVIWARLCQYNGIVSNKYLTSTRCTLHDSHLSHHNDILYLFWILNTTDYISHSTGFHIET
jgi:hypothetical protein